MSDGGDGGGGDGGFGGDAGGFLAGLFGGGSGGESAAADDSHADHDGLVHFRQGGARGRRRHRRRIREVAELSPVEDLRGWSQDSRALAATLAARGDARHEKFASLATLLDAPLAEAERVRSGAEAFVGHHAPVGPRAERAEPDALTDEELYLISHPASGRTPAWRRSTVDRKFAGTTKLLHQLNRKGVRLLANTPPRALAHRLTADDGADYILGTVMPPYPDTPEVGDAADATRRGRDGLNRAYEPIYEADQLTRDVHGETARRLTREQRERLDRRLGRT